MYDQQAKDLAFLYYCRGYSDERIEKAMRTGEGNDENAYPGWSRQLLYDRKTPLTPLDRGGIPSVVPLDRGGMPSVVPPVKEGTPSVVPPVKGGIKGGFYQGWKSKYNWEERRREIDTKKVEFEKRAEDIEDEMLEGLSTVVRTLLEKIKQTGKGVDSQTIHGFVNTAKLLMDIKKAKGSQDHSPIKEVQKGLTPEQVKEIEEQVLGLSR